MKGLDLETLESLADPNFIQFYSEYVSLSMVKISNLAWFLIKVNHRLVGL